MYSIHSRTSGLLCVALLGLTTTGLVGAASPDASTNTLETRWVKLESRWDTMMLQGEFGSVKDGDHTAFQAHASYADVDGWVNQVMKTRESIRVSLETGESIRGGLLRCVGIGARGALELYVKQLDRRRNFFVLVFRNEPHAKATILRQWPIPFDGPGIFCLRAP